MNLRKQILNDITDAMKKKDKETLNVIRMVKGAMQLEEIEKKRDLDDVEVATIIAKQIKQRKDANTEFEKGNRQDLIDKNNDEIIILNRYLPEQLNDKEIEKIVSETISELNVVDKTGMGKLMGVLSNKLKGKADMGSVNRIVKETLEHL